MSLSQGPGQLARSVDHLLSADSNGRVNLDAEDRLTNHNKILQSLWEYIQDLQTQIDNLQQQVGDLERTHTSQ
jgi:peptidoglycan hydrolase CwlO-like protein